MWGSLESAIERWVHGVGLIFMLAVIGAGATLIVALPLTLIAEIFGVSWLGRWSTITVATVFISLPYMLTHRDVAANLRQMFNPKLRE